MLQRMLFFLFLCSVQLNAQTDLPENKKLQSLLDSGEYFQFRNTLPQEETNLSLFDLHYFHAWNESLFGNLVISNSHIEFILENQNLNPGSGNTLGSLYQLQVQNLFRMCRYAEADSICKISVSLLTDANDKAEMQNMAHILFALKDVPAQTVERNADLELVYDEDMAGLIRIPVSIGGRKSKYIFDTGANISTVMESEAVKMKLRFLDAAFDVTSSSRKAIRSRLAVADELTIGNAVFHQVIFLVLPDDDLKFIGGLYKIKGIIGIPVIAQLGEVQISKKRIFSPYTSAQTTSPIRNLGFSGNTPFVELNFFGTDHAYIFDTGAAGTLLNSRFLRTYTDSTANAPDKKTRVGGAGGVQQVTIKRCSNLRFTFGDNHGILKTATAQTSGIANASSEFYGIVGEDIFRQCNTMIINFDHGFVVFK
jgi:predicted aspartyl protease